MKRFGALHPTKDPEADFEIDGVLFETGIGSPGRFPVRFYVKIDGNPTDLSERQERRFREGDVLFNLLPAYVMNEKRLDLPREMLDGFWEGYWTTLSRLMKFDDASGWLEELDAQAWPVFIDEATRGEMLVWLDQHGPDLLR